MRTGGSEQEVSKFLEEARHMKEFDHPNVLSLIGINVNENGLPQIVVPFMGGGDLLTYLRKHGAPVTPGSEVRADSFLRKSLVSVNFVQLSLSLSLSLSFLLPSLSLSLCVLAKQNT